MQKKKFKEEKGMTTGAIVLLVILIVIILVVGFFGLSAFSLVLNYQNNSIDNSENYNTDINSTKLDNNKTEAVLNGFKFTVPFDMICKVNNPGVSLELSTEDLEIQMVVKVTDNSYESCMQNPESLMEAAKNAGYQINKSIKEITVNGVKCAYYTCEGQGLHNLVAYTRGNSVKKISIQAVMDEKYDEKILEIFADIAKSVKETSEANSTDKELEKTNKSKQTVVEYDVTYTKEVASIEQAITEIKEEAERQRKKYNNPEVRKLETEMEEKYDIISVVLGEMDIETAKIVDNALETTLRIFPKIKGSFTNITIGNSISREPNAFARVKPYIFILPTNSAEYPLVIKNDILLEARYFLNPTRMKNAIASNAALGYWDKDSTIESLIAHELGHALVDLIRANRYGITNTLYVLEDNYQNYIKFLTDRLEINQTTAKEIVTNALGKCDENLTMEQFLSSISGYAASKNENTGGYNYEEACAEAYADYYIHGKDCDKASKLILAEIITYYNQYCN